jgi:diacylglycerol kinase (ATP)
MQRHLIVVNPAAGRGAGGKSIPLIRDGLDRAGIAYDLVCTERPWHAAELARQAAADGFYAVVAAGGDGTANEVINGLMQASGGKGGSTAMGALSVGRGNDFAFGAGIPKPLEEGIRTLAEDHKVRIDVGRVSGGLFPEGRFFGNGVGIGFDAVVGFEAVKMRRLSGFVSYIAAALKTVWLYDQGPLVRLAFDGQAPEASLPVLMVSIMNGRRMGGGFMMAPDGRPTDGVFDVCVVRQVKRGRVLGLIPHFMRGTQVGQPEITMHTPRRLVVTAERGVLPAHADGETLCTDGKELELELIPQSLDVITAGPVG